MLGLCPNIQSLQLSQLQRSIKCARPPTLPKLDQVKRLVFENCCGKPGFNLLAGIINSTPNLEWFEANGLEELDRNCAIIKAARECKRLRRVLHDFGEAGNPFKGEGFAALEDLSIEQYEGDEKAEMQLQVSLTDDCPYAGD